MVLKPGEQGTDIIFAYGRFSPWHSGASRCQFMFDCCFPVRLTDKRLQSVQIFAIFASIVAQSRLAKKSFFHGFKIWSSEKDQE